MKHLTVSERMFGEEHVIQEVDFSKMLMVTDDSIMFIGIKSQRELLRMLNSLVENLAMAIVGIDEDNHDHQDLLDSVLMETILAIDMATMVLGAASKYDEFKKESGKMLDIAYRLMNIGRDVVNISPNIHVKTGEELRKDFGEILMDELIESEKRDQKEEE